MYRCIVFGATLSLPQDHYIGEGATPEHAMSVCVARLPPRLDERPDKPTWQPSTHLVHLDGKTIGTVFPVMPHTIAHVREKVTTVHPPEPITHWPVL